MPNVPAVEEGRQGMVLGHLVADLLRHLPDEPLFGTFARLDVAPDEAPLVREDDAGVVVAEVDEDVPVGVDQHGGGNDGHGCFPYSAELGYFPLPLDPAAFCWSRYRAFMASTGVMRSRSSSLMSSTTGWSAGTNRLSW